MTGWGGGEEWGDDGGRGRRGGEGEKGMTGDGWKGEIEEGVCV